MGGVGEQSVRGKPQAHDAAHADCFMLCAPTALWWVLQGGVRMCVGGGSRTPTPVHAAREDAGQRRRGEERADVEDEVEVELTLLQ